MKWAILVSLYSFSALACVDLTGVYKQCERVRGSSTELSAVGFTIYKPEPLGNEFIINGESFMADAMASTETPAQTGNDTDLDFVNYCNESEFIRVLRDRTMPELEITYNLSKRDTALVIKITGKAPFNHIDDIFVCD